MKKSRLTFSNSNQLGQRQRKTKVVLGASVGLLALIVGATWLGATYESWFPFQGQNSVNQGNKTDSAVLSLASVSAIERAASLETIAQGRNSLDRSRARYLLATDLIQQKQGQKALGWLEGLEKEYPVLAAYVVLKRSQAYEVSGDKAKSQEALRNLVKSYPNSPVVAEALFILGKSEPKLWDQAIAQFPSHPRTLEIVQRRLKQNPNQPQLMLLLANYGFDTPGITSVLDNLVKQYAPQLKPEDWQAIAWIYWQNQQYGKAGSAYLGAPATSINAYRAARALELSGVKAQAESAYQYVVREFPQAQETGKSLIQIGKLSKPPEALSYFDQAITKFPEQAGEALIEKVTTLDKMQNSQAAESARQLLFTKYGSSEAAAEYRWTQAQKWSAAGDIQKALAWAKPIPIESPDSLYAPRAAFWVGKWSSQLGQQNEAKTAFENAVAQYPQSYYAWRSAVFLGWNVGDFTTLRQMNPRVVRPAERSQPPSGSATMKELYQLGQDQDAGTLWQAEFKNRMEPTVAEQFTDGLIQLKLGKHQLGMDRVSKLEDREKPEEQAQYKALRQQMIYWHALYPFPFMEIIETWSQERHINPLLVTALIRQESRFEPKISSVAGATGLMQVIPSTATWIAQNIKLKQFSLENPNDNIRLGTWYLNHTHEQYNNNSMLAVASYNAGPGNVAKWVKERGSLPPDEFVEAIPFEETKGYVKNVFGNYWNYLRLYNPEINEQVAKHSAAKLSAGN